MRDTRGTGQGRLSGEACSDSSLPAFRSVPACALVPRVSCLRRCQPSFRCGCKIEITLMSGGAFTLPGMREPLTGIDRTRRDRSITACSLAAAAVGDIDLPAARRGRLLMDCLGVLIAAHRTGRGPSMAQFRSGLSRPVRHLLPDDLPAGRIGDVVLLDSAGQLSDEARDLCVEHLVPSAAVDEHWSWAQVSAEQEERRVYATLRRL